MFRLLQNPTRLIKSRLFTTSPLRLANSLTSFPTKPSSRSTHFLSIPYMLPELPRLCTPASPFCPRFKEHLNQDLPTPVPELFPIVFQALVDCVIAKNNNKRTDWWAKENDQAASMGVLKVPKVCVKHGASAIGSASTISTTIQDSSRRFSTTARTYKKSKSTESGTTTSTSREEFPDSASGCSISSSPSCVSASSSLKSTTAVPKSSPSSSQPPSAALYPEKTTTAVSSTISPPKRLPSPTTPPPSRPSLQPSLPSPPLLNPTISSNTGATSSTTSIGIQKAREILLSNKNNPCDSDEVWADKWKEHAKKNKKQRNILAHRYTPDEVYRAWKNHPNKKDKNALAEWWKLAFRFDIREYEMQWGMERRRMEAWKMLGLYE